MKRKIFLLTVIILTLSLSMVACKQGDIGEAKAKELALDNINKMFHTNQTEATVSREQMGCLPDQVGAMATNGNAGETARWLYIVYAPSMDDSKYEAYVVASTGEVIFVSQSDANITLTDEQMKQAEQLLAEEPTWGNQHEKALSLLKQACNDWAVANLDESYPIVLEATLDRMQGDPVRTTFANWYYVITRDGEVYWIAMHWPSMQVSCISVKSAK